ncbi:MAG: HAMP domain-containing histidine kinase [Deltaproteobacteria bacterium]|nr:HAMP domain-containing histidine kinase [Deltaproteobacteria bacterium]
MREPYILIVDERGKLLHADDEVWEVLGSPGSRGYDPKVDLCAQGLRVLLEESTGAIELGKKTYRFAKTAWKNKEGGDAYLIKIYPPEDELIKFFSALIHEFKNPLGAIRALAQSLEERFKFSFEQKDTIRAYTGRIIREIDRLNSLLASVKYVSRPLIKDMQEFDLAEVVKEAAELYQEELRQRGIRIEVSLGTEMVPFWGTPDDFHQILSNLIKNAEEALEGKRDGRITIALRCADDKVEVEVMDNGIGIDDEVLESIGRRPFATTKSCGMGMGLYVVETLLEKYEGDLSLSKGPRGCGTKAKVTILLKREPNSPLIKMGRPVDA